MFEDFYNLPQLKRGLCWCRTCRRSERFKHDPLRNGWPRCCGHTMTIDSPVEQLELREGKANGY